MATVKDILQNPMWINMKAQAEVMTFYGRNAIGIRMDRLVSTSVLVQELKVFKIPAVS